MRLWSHPSRVCGLKYPAHSGVYQGRGSHPSRVCGLKSSDARSDAPAGIVTPLAGVWIEIGCTETIQPVLTRHTPRGCVD